jgi:hypothetical protein
MNVGCGREQPVDRGHRVGAVEPPPLLGHVAINRQDPIGEAIGQGGQPVLQRERGRDVPPAKRLDRAGELSDYQDALNSVSSSAPANQFPTAERIAEPGPHLFTFDSRHGGAAKQLGSETVPALG